MKKQIFLFLALALIVAGGAFAQQAGSVFNGNGNRYEVVSQTMSWEDAKREAERRGGYLATITSAEENALVQNLIAGGDRRCYWIGGYCENDRVWKWVTGEPMNYTNWAPGEPSNSGRNQDKMCIIRRPYNNRVALGQWDDDRNTINEYGFVIEWDYLVR